MRFKRRPNEIKPPPIFLSLSLVAKGAERLIRDFSSVISLPRRENDGTRLASCRPGQRLHVQYHPVAFGGLQDDGPLPVVLLRRFRGASESLSSWRQLAKKRERADHGKTVPFQGRVIDVSRDERLEREFPFPRDGKIRAASLRFLLFDWMWNVGKRGTCFKGIDSLIPRREVC